MAYLWQIAMPLGNKFCGFPKLIFRKTKKTLLKAKGSHYLQVFVKLLGILENLLKRIKNSLFT